jgi:hypothetical protein
MKRSNQAQIALNKKLKLERKLHKSTSILFREIALNAHEPFINVSAFSGRLESILYGHYEETFDVFGFDYSRKHRITVTGAKKAAINIAAKDKFKEKARNQAAIIIDTSVRQLDIAKTLAREKLPELRKINPNITFNKHVNDTYKAALNRRVDAIAAYETQWPAEYSKANEVSYITDDSRKHNKRWDAIGDDKMRDWHAYADSQIVLAQEPFRVNGELLMYPGDTSLGATTSNIVHCRCSATYELSRDALARV